jgi:hypothetical protein
MGPCLEWILDSEGEEGEADEPGLELGLNFLGEPAKGGSCAVQIVS